jgi:hypothetical protein
VSPPFSAGHGGHFSTGLDGLCRFIVTFQSAGFSLLDIEAISGFGAGMILDEQHVGLIQPAGRVAS